MAEKNWDQMARIGCNSGYGRYMMRFFPSGPAVQSLAWKVRGFEVCEGGEHTELPFALRFRA